MGHFLEHDWPAEAVVQEIVDKLSGQFIYASVVMNFISSARSHPAHQDALRTSRCIISLRCGMCRRRPISSHIVSSGAERTVNPSPTSLPCQEPTCIWHQTLQAKTAAAPCFLFHQARFGLCDLLVRRNI